MSPSISATEFMTRAPTPLNANTPWGARYAAELRRVVVEHARQAPRSLQVHLGPSELGHACNRQVVGKMARVPATNHVGPLAVHRGHRDPRLDGRRVHRRQRAVSPALGGRAPGNPAPGPSRHRRPVRRSRTGDRRSQVLERVADGEDP